MKNDQNAKKAKEGSLGNHEKTEGMQQEPRIAIPRSILVSLIALANGYLEDIDSGLEDGTYDPEDNEDNDSNHQEVSTAEALLRDFDDGKVISGDNNLLQVAQGLSAALDGCVTQIEQMKGMFGDEDGCIQSAIDAAEEAQALFESTRSS